MPRLPRLTPTARALSAVLATLALSGCLAIMPLVAPKAKDVEEGISSAFPYEYQFIDVMGSEMAYVEAGDPEGPPILLVHGNPTSSYLWRNIIPHLEERGRIIAVDLIGMGKSDKPDIAYRFRDHTEYFTGFVEAMGLDDIILVLHDWGGGIGTDYAANHEDNVRGIAMFEMVVKPMSLSDADLAMRYLFGRMRDPEAGYSIVAEDNYFVERLLPMMSGRRLTDEEMAVYRAPFPTVESRLPVRQWPMEIPLDGVPADTTAQISSNYTWLQSSDTPLFFLYAEPGMIWTEATRPELFEDLPRMKTASVGSGLHYLQEVQPTKIGMLIADWIDTLPQ
ncbi:MAG: haloalkane dehalogenase [Pseudomonadota bacterium]